ncbi:MAG: murein hydrolase activator [Alphaproteobacteria bacterium]|nr:murein hydrolase activator [Alphaproteobacteria bacterium]
MRIFICRVSCLYALCGLLWLLPVQAQDAPENMVSDLNARLVQTAMLIQAREQEVLDGETKLDELKLRRRSQLARFDSQRGELSQMLAAMQRLGRQPPALLLIRSEAAVEHVRGAVLLGAVIEGVEKEAAALRKDLAEIDRLESVMSDEHEQHIARLAELQEEQQALSGLLTEQKGQQAALFDAAATNAEAMAALAKRAKDAGDLLARLEKSAAAGAKEVKSDLLPRPRPQAAEAAAEDAPEETQDYALFSPVSPPEPETARPVQFSAARGLLAIPARGKIVAKFGARDASGAVRRGISIRTRESAEIIAPFDGKVVFAGPFRAYGQLLILEAGEGYHILLSGLSLVHGVVGQNVTQGQPVGRMGTGPKGDAPVQSGTGSDLRDLYVEFRKDGKPFDPMPWLKSSEKKVSG